MSRSYKKSPCLTWCGNTNKLSKRTCNRMFRRLAKIRLAKGRDLPIKSKEVMDVYDFNTDGLAMWRNNLEKKFLRK